MTTRIAALGAVATAAALLSGCGRHDLPISPRTAAPWSRAGSPAEGAQPQTSAFHVRMESLWPHEDGRAWIYRGSWDAVGGIGYPAVFPSADAVPAATLDLAERMLASPFGTGRDTLAFLGIPFGYKLQFTGSLVAGWGVLAQNLVETRWELVSDRSLRVGTADPGDLPLDVPAFIHGGAWWMTRDSIETLPNLVPRSRFWRFLESDLRPGSEFSLILSRWNGPGDPTVSLSARVLSPLRLRNEHPSWKKAVEVLYLLDRGVHRMRDSSGTVGYVRPFDFGTVLYVSGVGPVRVREYRSAFAGSEPAGARAEVLLDLESTNGLHGH